MTVKMKDKGDYMYNTKTVITINKYGKIYLCLKEVMNAKKITRNNISKATDTRFEVINKWYKNDVKKLDLDVLARICYVLECSPGDIIKYGG